MKVVGGLMILGGIVLGLYVGLYLMFVGGIVSIVNGAVADPVNGGAIVWGLVRIAFAVVTGTISAWVLVIPGLALLAKG